MLARRFLLTLVALLSVLIGARPSNIDASVLGGAADDCISGVTTGDWVLPRNTGGEGYATGYFFVDNVLRPRFYFVASLNEWTPPGTRERYGEIFGVLYDLNSPSEVPAYFVYGEWFGVATQGVWATAFYDVSGGVVGAANGSYVGPSPIGTPIGQYRGQWYLCE